MIVSWEIRTLNEAPDSPRSGKETHFHVKLKGSQNCACWRAFFLPLCVYTRACVRVLDSLWPVHYRAILLLLLLLVTAAVAMTAAQQSPAVQRVSGMPRPHLFILTQTTECWTKTTPPRRTEENNVCVCVFVSVYACEAFWCHVVPSRHMGSFGIY